MSVNVYNDLKFIEAFKHCGIVAIPIYAGLTSPVGIATFISEFRNSLLSGLTRRAILYGGLQCDNKEILERALSELDELTRKEKVVYTKINCFPDMGPYLSTLKGKGYDWEPHLNYLIHLSLGEEVVWKKISESRRKQIKRAERRGLSYRYERNLVDFDDHYTLLKMTYKRAGLPLVSRKIFDEVLRVFGKNDQVLVVNVLSENQLVGFRIILLSDEQMLDWYAGADESFYSMYPNDLAVWATLKWGMEQGYQIFDFGGAGHPDKPYGVREFKKKFGGEEVNYGILQKINRPLLNRFLQSGIQLYKIIKAKRAH